MNWAVRGLFIALLLSVLIAQANRLTSNNLEPDEEAILVQRFARLGTGATVSTASSVLTATVSGCREPVAITYVDANGAGDEKMQALLANNVVARYVYLGAVSSSIGSAAVVARWAAASALTALGLRLGYVTGKFVVVLLPKACPELTKLNWSVLSPWAG